MKICGHCQQEITGDYSEIRGGLGNKIISYLCSDCIEKITEAMSKISCMSFLYPQEVQDSDIKN